MKRTRTEAWALKTRHGQFASRGAFAFQDGLPTALFKTKRNAMAMAEDIDPKGVMVQPVKVYVTITEVGI
jgi:hypothetical protein